MKAIAYALLELKKTLVSITLITAFLDFLIVFLIAYLLAMLLTVPHYLALIPAFLYLVFHSMRTLRRISLEGVEAKVPVLNEQLRTVADNLDKENRILEDLNEDVLQKMKMVRVSYFINFKKMWRSILLIGAFCFIIIVLASLNVKFFNLDNFLNDLKDLQNPPPPPPTPDDLEENQGGGGTDIFGEESLAELGNKELNLKINPLLSEIDINKVEEAKKRDFKPGERPAAIEAASDRSFIEPKIAKENQHLVKNYFQGIAQK